MYAWLALSVLALLCVHAFLWLRGRRARSMLAYLPCYPTTLPIIGNIHQILGNAEHLFKVLQYMTKMSEEHRKPFVCWLGHCPIALVSDPEDVKAVTNAFIEKPYFYNFAKDYVGNGLVTAPGLIWKRMNKKLAGAFTTMIVDGYQDVFNIQAAKLVEKLKGEFGKEPFDVLHKYLAFTTLETISQTAFGVPHVSMNIVTSSYYKAFIRTFELFIERGMNIFYHPDFIYKLTPAYKELKNCVAVLHNVSDTIINKRREERSLNRINGNTLDDSENTGKVHFKAFLDMLLELEEVDPTLTAQQIQSEVNTIIVGGQETIAVTLFMTLLMVGCRPRIQDALYAEMKEIFGDSKRPVEKNDLQKMQYLEAVIYETLRIFPPLPVVARYADADLKLRSCTVPAGTAMLINVWGAGRSQHTWGPDAEDYRPERWLTGDRPNTNSPSFIAFSYGKRACIGKRYAIVFLKTILAHCVRELLIDSEADNLKLKLDVGLKAVSGHLITVRSRKGNTGF